MPEANGAVDERTLEERLTPRQRELYCSLMESVVGQGPLALSPEEEELLVGLPDESRVGPGRPLSITRQKARWLVALAKLPYTFGEICRTIGISYEVFKLARRRHPGLAAALVYARTVRIARIAQAREEAVKIAIATGDWQAAVRDHADERKRLSTEEKEDPWANPEQVAVLIAARLREELEPPAAQA